MLWDTLSELIDSVFQIIEEILDAGKLSSNGTGQGRNGGGMDY